MIEFVTIQEQQREVLAASRELWDELADKLATVGGRKLVIPPGGEHQLESITRYGEDLTGPVRLVEGQRGRCHFNVSQMWLAGAVEQIATGYALSAEPDGMWRQHTWGVSESGHLIETTTERERYFGVVLDDASAFARAQTSPLITQQ